MCYSSCFLKSHLLTVTVSFSSINTVFTKIIQAFTADLSFAVLMKQCCRKKKIAGGAASQVGGALSEKWQCLPKRHRRNAVAVG